MDMTLRMKKLKQWILYKKISKCHIEEFKDDNQLSKEWAKSHNKIDSVGVRLSELINWRINSFERESRV